MRVIDVRDLIARYSPAEHAAKADAYFAEIERNWLVRRKPWANSTEAQTVCRALWCIIGDLQLRPGMRLLDFGAGTCWLSLIFAYLGCEVVAVDVSARALEQGARIKAEDPIGRDLPIAFARFDSVRLPLPDADVDRIVCMDSFHHVADQEGTLREFFRVLRPGGRIAFAEPGPEHSRAPQSQYEMRQYGVIENDIVVEDLDRYARDIGFEHMRIALAPVTPAIVDLESFARWSARGFAPGETESLAKSLAGIESRIFFLRKPGDEESDSRAKRGLAGALTAQIEYRAEGPSVTFAAVNTGTARWLPSGGTVGAVNLGAMLIAPDGRIVNRELARTPVSANGVAPGDSVNQWFELPPIPDGHRIDLVLVSEFVAWFDALAGWESTITTVGG